MPQIWSSSSSIQDTVVGSLNASGCGLQPENKEIVPPWGPKSKFQKYMVTFMTEIM